MQGAKELKILHSKVIRMHIAKKADPCTHMLESTCYVVHEQTCSVRIAYNGKMELLLHLS